MLSDKCVMVVGGAGLLGKAICEGLAAAHAKVVVADRLLAAAEDVATQISDKSGTAIPLEIDITDTSSIDAALVWARTQFGDLNGLVNSAYPRNANYGRKLEDVTYADFAENISLHLGGYFLVAQRAAMHFRDHGGGSIVSLGSIYGQMAPRFEVYEQTAMTMPVEYAAIKAGISHLSRYFAQTYKSAGVRCNVVAPGGIEDGQPEAFLAKYRAFAGKIGMLNPQDVVGAIVYLLSDAARAVTGQTLVVDDGFSL